MGDGETIEREYDIPSLGKPVELRKDDASYTGWIGGQRFCYDKEIGICEAKLERELLFEIGSEISRLVTLSNGITRNGLTNFRKNQTQETKPERAIAWE